MSNAMPDNTVSPLRDVHAIATELMPALPDQMPTEADRSKIIRVERHAMSRAPDTNPSHHGASARSLPASVDTSAMQGDFTKLDRKLEAILKSVEFTEAHLAMSRKPVAVVADERLSQRSTRWWKIGISFAMNVILLGLLVAEVNSRFVSETGQAYLAALLRLTGWQ
jgi:hypothetical protein